MGYRNKKSRRSRAPFILFGAGIILILASMVWAGQLRTPPAAGADRANVPLPDIERVSVEDSFRAFEQGQAVFLDVRFAENYNEGHIPGAVLIPETELPERWRELDPEQWIITYCT